MLDEANYKFDKVIILAISRKKQAFGLIIPFTKSALVNIFYLVSMRINLHLKFSKYAKIELIFFLVYFYIFRLLTDFEYNLWERHHTGISLKDIEFDLLYGTSSMLSFFVFYKVLQYCLIKEKLWTFIGFVFLFLIADHFYAKLVYLLYANLDFLSAGFRNDALKYYHSKTLGYTLSYILREFLAIGSLAYFVHSAQQQEEMKALKEQQLIAELTYLKAQLQPHFFFNTLNNIYALALQQSKETAPLVATLSEMMRYILYESDRELVPLKKEIAFINNYVEAEHIRYRSAIEITFDVQGIDEHTLISPLLLLPLIENAFKHGLQEETSTGFVQIVICQTEAELILEVKNSIALSTMAKTGGIGLANLKKRLEILYQENYKLEIKNDGKVYQVLLTLSINEE